MLTVLLTRTHRKGLPLSGTGRIGQKARAARYYRVDVTYNLFGEYSVMREWGASGRPGQHLLVWFSNLREACIAAEHWRKHASRRGYSMEGQIE